MSGVNSRGLTRDRIRKAKRWTGLTHLENKTEATVPSLPTNPHNYPTHPSLPPTDLLSHPPLAPADWPAIPPTTRSRRLTCLSASTCTLNRPVASTRRRKRLGWPMQTLTSGGCADTLVKLLHVKPRRGPPAAAAVTTTTGAQGRTQDGCGFSGLSSASGQPNG